MRLLHTADLHLGYKFSSVFSDWQRERLYANQRQMFLNILDTATARHVDALLIAGDLFDSKNPEEELVRFVKDGLAKYGNPVYIACGNHDPYTISSVYSRESFSDNVFIFGKDVSKFEIGEGDIYGFGFTAPHSITNHLKSFKAQNPQKINILLAHGELKADSFYNPILLSDIENSGLDYLALGHIHKAEEIKKLNNTYYGYCGAPQGINFKDEGDFSVLIVDISKDSFRVSPHKTEEHKFTTLDIDLSGAEDTAEAKNRIFNELSKYNIGCTLFNLRIKGTVNSGVNIDFPLIEEELNAHCFYAKISSRLRIHHNLELMKKEDSPRGAFVRTAANEISDSTLLYKVIECGVEYL